MMTSSNGNISALLALCAGNSPVSGEFPTQRPVTRSFDVFFDLRPNKRLSKQSWGWWFETLSSPLWRHRNELSSRPCGFARIYTLRPIQNGRNFTEDISKFIAVYGNCCIWILIFLKIAFQGPINNIPTLVLITAWRRTDNHCLNW